jgi:hypothetical protein
VIVPVVVDDITLASTSKTKIQDIKQELAKHFKLRDLGPTTFQLGVEIICDCPNCTLHLSQCQYCLDILKRFSFANASPVSTPLDPVACLECQQTMTRMVV